MARSWKNWFSSPAQRKRRSRAQRKGHDSRDRWRKSMRMEMLEPRLMLSTVQRQDLTLGSSDTTTIEIGGPDPGETTLSDGYDQIQVANGASLDGHLQVQLMNDYVPAVGTTFDFLTVGGSRSGKFADAEGLFSFPDGDRYFDIVSNGSGLQLVVKAVDGLQFAPPSESRNALGEFLSSYFDGTQFNYTGDLSVPGFATFSGNLFFDDTSGQSLVAANGVTAQLGTASCGVQITSASFGLVLPGDGTYALEATGDGRLSGIPNFTMSGNMFAERNTTGAAVTQTITVHDAVDNEDLSATIGVASSAKRFAGTGLQLGIDGFADVTGDIGFDLSGGNVIAVAGNVTATISAGGFSVGVTGGTFGMVAKTDDTTAFEARGSFSLSGGDFGSASATSALVQYTSAGLTVAADTTLTVGSTTYTFDDGIEAGTVAVEATGLAASVSDFVSLSGDVGFKKSGTKIIAVGSDVTAGLTAGTASVSLANADFGLQTGGGQTAFELKNGAFSATIDGLASVTATSALVQYTNATTTVTAGTALTV
ncbi:MAG: hypothetical protein NTY19_45575, partial [Planctomycetota bacterium]|nr:hypothetical protein [Planctomycetota bacterium]